MSRSVSAPSSVTNTSPCWNGLIVPGSTLRYGSNFWALTERPRALSSRPSEAATMPFPSAETTPPVTNTYLATGSHRSTEPGWSRSPRTPGDLESILSRSSYVLRRGDTRAEPRTDSRSASRTLAQARASRPGLDRSHQCRRRPHARRLRAHHQGLCHPVLGDGADAALCSPGGRVRGGHDGPRSRPSLPVRDAATR